MCKKTTKQRNDRPAQLNKHFSKTSLGLGFSLIELLFTMALLSILLSLAFPVYRHLIAQLRLFTLTERINMHGVRPLDEKILLQYVKARMERHAQEDGKMVGSFFLQKIQAT